MPRDRREKSLLIFLTALGFFARLAFLIFFENVFSTESEAYSKINLVFAWIAHGKPYPDPNFGPLHTWLIYFLTLPFEDRVLPVRLFSLLCGTATIPVFYFLAKRQVGAGAAMIAAGLFAVFPVHLRASATSLAEAPYTLAFFCGLLAFVIHQGRRTASAWCLVLSAACMTLAAMFRFEAWLFYPVLCLFALRRGLVRAVGYGAMLIAFPAWHMFICWKTTGNPLSFGETSAASFLLYLPQMPLSYRATAWPVAYWHALSPPLSLLCAAGFCWAALRRRGGLLAALFLFPYVLLSYRTIQGMIDPALLRYGVLLGALAIPLGGGMIAGVLAKVFPAVRPRRIATLVTMTALMGFMLFWSLRQAEENRLPRDVKAVARFLKEETRPEDRIIMDKRFHPYLVVESRRDPESFRSLRYKAGAISDAAEYRAMVRRLFPLSHGHGEEITWGRDIKRYDEEAFGKMMDAFRPTMLVLDYESGGNMQAFPIPPDQSNATLYERRFERRLRVGDFAVFRIRPGEEAP